LHLLKTDIEQQSDHLILLLAGVALLLTVYVMSSTPPTLYPFTWIIVRENDSPSSDCGSDGGRDPYLITSSLRDFSSMESMFVHGLALMYGSDIVFLGYIKRHSDSIVLYPRVRNGALVGLYGSCEGRFIDHVINASFERIYLGTRVV
jgi:hypothetical protein